MKKLEKFTPLVFLAPLGAGGIAVMPFVLMQYTVEHGAGLITRAQLWEKGFSNIASGYYLSLEAVMIIFTVLHLVLMISFSISFFKWLVNKRRNG